MSYRLARSLVTLRAHIDSLAPRRSRSADGWIGDAAHASRESDHNPWVIDPAGVGVVRALDITDDPDSGASAARAAEDLRLAGKRGDPRLQDGGYVIFDRRIASERTGWEWEHYGGSNPHTGHVHVSVSRELAGYDSTDRWPVLLPTVSVTLMQRAHDRDRSRAAGSAPRQTRRVQQALGMRILSGRWGIWTRRAHRRRFPDVGTRPTKATLRTLGRGGRFRVTD